MAAVRELAGWKEPVVVATTANVDVATGGLLTIDGVVTVAGGRVLVKDQTDASENGIYLASAGEWYRAPDAMSSRNIDRGIMVWVQVGTANASTVWRFTTFNPDIGTDDIDLVLMDFGGGEATVLEYATTAEVRSSADVDKIITPDKIESAAAFVALTDAATIAVDWDASLNFSVTLGDNRTLGNPTNGQPGTWRSIIITQDGTGNRTLAFGDQYHFVSGTAPTMSIDAAAVDVLSILCVTASLFYVFVALDMGAA
jgi:phage-related tail fiber protein